MASKKDLPHLLKAIHWWHPGSWGPPAETITLASVVVVALALWRLFRNEVVVALFKFQFNPVWLSLASTAIAVLIVWVGSKRPGSRPPRIWALAVAVCSFALVVWALYLRAGGSSGSPAGDWDNPRLHALSAVGLAAALALLPRLFRVHPYSLWVRWAAPASLAAVALLCWFSVQFAEGTVIHAEETRLDNLARGVEATTKEILNVLHPAPKSVSILHERLAETRTVALEELSFKGHLPTSFDWQRLNLLHRQEEMRAALSHALESVGDGMLNFQDLKLAGPQPPQRKDTWLSRDAERAARYFHELGRLYGELAIALRTSPFAQEYESQEQPMDVRLKEYSTRFNQQWIPALFTGKGDFSSIEQLMKSHVGSFTFELGDFDAWKNLSWPQVQSMRGMEGCEARPIDGPRSREITEVIATPSSSAFAPPAAAPAGAPASPAVNERRVTVYDHSESFECYAYRPSSDSNRIEILAELHLTESFRDCRSQFSGCKSASRGARLLFYVPPGVTPAQYREQMTVALGNHGRYRLRPDVSRGSLTVIEIEIQ